MVLPVYSLVPEIAQVPQSGQKRLLNRILREVLVVQERRRELHAEAACRFIRIVAAQAELAAARVGRSETSHPRKAESMAIASAAVNVSPSRATTTNC